MNAVRAAPAELHDIVVPEPVGWMPQTTGSWILAGVILLVLLWLLGAAVRRHRANRYRRWALSRLQTIEQTVRAERTKISALRAIPVLVKETVIAVAPRPDVAGLAGPAWLEFLDASYGGRGFTTGPGRLLPVLAYGTPAEVRGVDPTQVEALFDLVRSWIRRHRVRV